MTIGYKEKEFSSSDLGKKRIIRRYASFPTTLTTGEIIWLEPYLSEEEIDVVHVEAGCGSYEWVSKIKSRL